MKRLAGVPWEALLLAFVVASMPVSPAFVLLASVTPPGISVLPLPFVVADLLLCILVSAAIFIRLVRERAPLSPLARPIAAYVGSWLLAALLGFDIITGLLMALALVMAAILHAGIYAWRERPHVLRVLYATFLITGTPAALLGIAMVVMRRPALLYAMVHGRAASTFIVPGEFAAYLLLLIPVAFGVALTARSTFFRCLGIAGLLSGVVALGMTYSRAGWLGAGAGAAFFLYAYSRQCGKSRLYGALVGAAPIVVLAGVARMFFHGHHNPSEDFVRLPIWQAGLRTIELFPLTGAGPGSFRHVYPLLRPIAGEPGAFHAHNILLTAFAETGLIGVLALCALWFCFIGAFRARLREAAPARGALALAIVTGFVATWAQGMLDFLQIVVLGCWLPFMALAFAAAERGFPDS